MACITVFAPWAMATTQLTRIVPFEEVFPVQPETNLDRSTLRMSWVAAVGPEGNRVLRMRWTSSVSDR